MSNMNHKGILMKQKTIFAAMLFMITTGSVAESKERVLYSFDKSDSARPWQTVNDGVMGGRSDPFGSVGGE